MVCQGGASAVAAFAGGFGPPHGREGPVSARAGPAAGLSASGRVHGGGCQPSQCFETSNEPALSGRSVCGAAQGGMVSGRKRRRRITMAPPQAQRQTGRCSGVCCDACAAEGCKCSTCNRCKARRLLWCRKPKFLARCKPLGKTCCRDRHCATEDQQCSDWSRWVLPGRHTHDCHEAANGHCNRRWSM